MRLYPDSKVYVLCPANTNTGGPESLHQLCSQLITFGVNAFMFYGIIIGEFNPDDPVHPSYKKYHLPYVLDAEDSKRNVLIMPEASATMLRVCKNIQRVFWWMSVDNYIVNITKIISDHMKDPLAKPVPKIFYFDKADSDIEHWTKSEYSRQFLKINGINPNKCCHVETYMNQTFFDRAAKIDLSRKENIVVYNPKKGIELTRAFIKVAPDIDWRPIQNMTPEQVQELLARAKVYIDFGNHPGRDRLPREAAICRCVVIVGKRGAAINDIDINIPAEFKFDLKSTKPQQVIEKIRETFDNFESSLTEQEAFRQRVYDDRKNFASAVAAAFGIKNFPPPSIAFTQGVSEETFLLAQELFRSKEFAPRFIVDDAVAAEEVMEEPFLREQNRNFLRVGANRVEIITRDDAKFLYQEGRIKKFALFEPTDDEIAEVKNFYAPSDADVLLVD